MGHVVLLGDSTFDNASYVRGGPDVIRQVQRVLPAQWRATLMAVDGAVTRSVHDQIDRMPSDPSHLVVSVGGNDALGYSSLLAERVATVAEAVGRLAEVAELFERDYAALLDHVLGHGLPTAVCTIYDPRFPEPPERRDAITALAVINDRILRQAFARSLPVLDLRLICDSDEDFANPIEPSARGGEKIAAAIARFAVEAEFRPGRSEIFIA